METLTIQIFCCDVIVYGGKYASQREKLFPNLISDTVQTSHGLTFMHIIGIFNYVRFEVHKYVIKSDAASGLIWHQFDLVASI